MAEKDTITKPVIVVGGGPVGLTTALGLGFYGLPFQLFEEDDALSSDTKAGTILTRTIETFRRYGVADQVLAKALRIDEIGDVERATNIARPSVNIDLLADETRYPFVINLPQHHLEPILHHALDEKYPGCVHLKHKLKSFRQNDDGVTVTFDTPDGEREVEGAYLLACDGGRSTVRSQLGIAVEGASLDVLTILVDVKVDLDVQNPRDYPYLAYFADPSEWMILVRQPHCWRFLFPLAADRPEPTREEFREKILRFIGPVSDLEIINTVVYRIHHRIATEWRDGRVFLMGDAAHLITPNQFELELLSGVKIADTDGLRAAAAALTGQRRIDVVATGCTLADTPAGQVETILCADGQLSRFATPRLPIRPYGTGDLLTGLIAAHLAKGTAIEAAVRLAVETIFAVLVRTQAAGSEEMRLVPLPTSGA